MVNPISPHVVDKIKHMIINVKLELKTHFLGSHTQNRTSKPRQFIKINDTMVKIFQDDLTRSLQESAKMLNINMEEDAYKLPDGFNAPVWIVYPRKYNKIKTEEFEAVPKGATITLKFAINEQKISKEDFILLLQTVGDYYGISQFGNKFGYGRFKILEVSEVTVANSLQDIMFN